MNAPTQDDANESPGDSTPRDAGLSADQLSQAFAQFMDQGENDLSSPVDGAETEASPIISERTAAETDPEESVTPASILEAMLFVGHPKNENLTARMLASVMRGVSPSEVDTLVLELNRGYDEQNSAYRIVREDDGYRMSLRKEFSTVRETFYGKVREAKLSQNAIDILSVVAYHQPVERNEIDRLSGKTSGSVLGQLVRRELLSVEHVGERPKKKIYRTTDRFLELFNIDSLEDLPRGEDF